MKTTSELELLDKFGINDWRGLKKDQVITLYNSLKDAPPEVAKAAIAQFPNYVDAVKSLAIDYKDVLSKAVDHASESSKARIELLSKQSELLISELEIDDLSYEQRMDIFDRLADIDSRLSDVAKQDNDLAKFITKIATGAFLFAVGTLASIIGVNIAAKNTHTEDDNSEE